MEKAVKILLALGLLLIGYAVYKGREKKTPLPEKKIVHLTDVFVDRDRIQLLPLSKNRLAESGSFILEKDILQKDSVLIDLDQQEKNLILVQVFRQFSEKMDANKPLLFYLDKPWQPWTSLLNQYGVPQPSIPEPQFLPQEKSGILAKIGSQSIGYQDLEKSSYHWGDLETRRFHRSIEVIKEQLGRKAVTQAVLDAGKNTQVFIEEKRKSEKAAHKKSLSVSQWMTEFALENILELPIKASLSLPQFEIELKPEWTPRMGPSQSGASFIVFDNFYSQWARNFLKVLPQLNQKFPNIAFGFRPVFNSKDQFQNMLAEMGFCVWAKHPKEYFPFIARGAKIKPQNFEKDLYREIQAMDLPLSPLKECFYKQEHKSVVQYHQDYARYLQIKAGPVIFFDGMVYTDSKSIADIEKLLNQSGGG